MRDETEGYYGAEVRLNATQTIETELEKFDSSRNAEIHYLKQYGRSLQEIFTGSFPNRRVTWSRKREISPKRLALPQKLRDQLEGLIRR